MKFKIWIERYTFRAGFYPAKIFTFSPENFTTLILLSLSSRRKCAAAPLARRKAKLDFSSRSCLLPGVARCMPAATARRARSAVRPYQMKTTILHHFDSFCLPLHRIYKPCVPQFEVRHSELANRDLVATDLASAARKIRFVIKALQRSTSQLHLQYSKKDVFLI